MEQTSIIFVNLFIGLLFIGSGFLVKRSPDILAGYNSMSKEQKKNVDFAGLSIFMKKASIITGMTFIVLSVLLMIFRFEILWNIFIMISACFLGPAIAFFKARKFDHNKRKTNVHVYYIIGGIITLFFVGGLLFNFSVPSKTIFEEETIKFSGSYGFTINISDIESVELVDKIPAIKIRTNGICMGGVSKGRFSVESWGTCRLLMHSKKPPFLIITKNNGEKFIINYYKPSETENIFKQIRNAKDTIVVVKSRRDVMLVEERMPEQPMSCRDVMLVETRRDVMSVEEHMAAPPMSRRDVMSVEERMAAPPMSCRDVMSAETRRDVIREVKQKHYRQHTICQVRTPEKKSKS